MAYEQEENNQQAEDFLSASISMYKSIEPKNSTLLGFLSRALETMGSLYMEDEPTKAIPLLKEALEMRLKAEGSTDHPQVAFLNYALGTCHAQLDQFTEALSCLGESRKIYKKIFGDEENEDIQDVEEALENVRELIKFTDFSVKYYKIAYSVWENPELSFKSLIRKYPMSYDKKYAVSEQLETSINYLMSQLDSTEGNLYDKARLYNCMGWVYFQENEYSKSCDQFRLALQFHSPLEIQALFGLAYVSKLDDEYQEAIIHFEKILPLLPETDVESRKVVIISLIESYKEINELQKTQFYENELKKCNSSDTLRNALALMAGAGVNHPGRHLPTECYCSI